MCLVPFEPVTTKEPRQSLSDLPSHPSRLVLIKEAKPRPKTRLSPSASTLVFSYSTNHTYPHRRPPVLPCTSIRFSCEITSIRFSARASVSPRCCPEHVRSQTPRSYRHYTTSITLDRLSPYLSIPKPHPRLSAWLPDNLPLAPAAPTPDLRSSSWFF